jgi:hypothetical protein
MYILISRRGGRGTGDGSVGSGSLGERDREEEREKKIMHVLGTKSSAGYR